MYIIGIIDTMNEKGLKLFDQKKNFSYEIINDLSRENLKKELPKFDGVTLRRGKLDAEILSKCKNLKVISRHGVGYDNVDVDFLKENNISLLVTHNSTSTSPFSLNLTKPIVVFSFLKVKTPSVSFISKFETSRLFINPSN